MFKLRTARPSSNSQKAPIHTGLKRDGDWRSCGDYRRLNACTYPDRYLVHHIHGQWTKINSKIDLVRGYNQLSVVNEDVPKIAIITPFGLFKFSFIGFGLRYATQTFQRFIDEVLSNLGSIYACIDDIQIVSKVGEQHLEHFKIVVNSLKCKFGQDDVILLSYIVWSAGIAPSPGKVAIIQNFPEPKTAKQLR